jgi:L-lactate dehydrogenase complex protein LldG
MSARDAVLGKVRRSLGVTGAEPMRLAAVERRLAEAPKGIPVARGHLPPAERVALFVEKLESVSATAVRVGSEAEVPAAIADYLRCNNLPSRIKRGEDPWLAGLPWDSQPTLEVELGRAEGSDLVGLSHAMTGAAESGTLILTSGPDNPTTLSFLPETHVICIRAEDVVPDYEAVWERLREAHGKGRMPRTVNMITGPSRSGDIEQTILLGAHGPRSLHVIVVG